MNFLHSDLGLCSQGETVVVTLSGDSVNVMLLDQINFSNYQNGHDYRYYGNHVTRSPYRIQIPHGGHWHVVIDRGGYPGTVQASVRVE